MFKSLLLLNEDFCIKIKSVQTPSHIDSFKFRYWLSPQFIKQQVGKIKKLSVKRNIKIEKPINLSDFVIFNDHTFEELENEGSISWEQVQKMFKTRIIVPIQNNKKVPDNSDVIRKEKTNSIDDYNIHEILKDNHFKTLKPPQNDREQVCILEEIILNGIIEYSKIYEKYLREKGLMKMSEV